MRRDRFLPFFLIVCALAGCEGEEAEQAEAERAAEELAGEPESEGYDPGSLPWLREGRPVLFETLEWRPVGQPIAASSESFRRVGEFEGMALYAAKDDDPPHEILFFPLGNNLWQPLEPTDTVLSESSP